MTLAQNLTPDEWSKVLESEGLAQAVARNVTEDRTFPWTPTLIELTRDCASTLDMGSGRGELAAVMAREGKKSSLLDWSEKNIAFSKDLFKRLGLEGDFRQADMTQRLPYVDGQFDAVYSCGVFEYFTDDQIKAILKEAFRIARKRVIILVPNSWSLPYRFGKWYLEKTKQWVWGGERTFSSLKPHFLAAGCSNVNEFSVGTRHSLDFLTMRGGRAMQKAAISLFRLKNHPRPSTLNQGYLLIAAGEKKG